MNLFVRMGEGPLVFEDMNSFFDERDFPLFNVSGVHTIFLCDLGSWLLGFYSSQGNRDMKGGARPVFVRKISQFIFLNAGLASI